MGSGPPHEIVFEAFGVHGCVAAPTATALDLMRPALPPGWCPSAARSPAFRFELAPAGANQVRVEKDGVALSADLPLDVARDTVERELRIEVALRAPGLIFVHSGAVAYHGRALLLPGATFTGKTSLVAALVRAGATYLSDEYAVLDLDGRVHPYARPLGIRVDGIVPESHAVEELGGTAGDNPVPVAVVAVTSYREGASWDPQRLQDGEAVLALLEHAVVAQSRPAESLRAARMAVDGAQLLRGERGDADVAAALLLALLDERFGD